MIPLFGSVLGEDDANMFSEKTIDLTSKLIIFHFKQILTSIDNDSPEVKMNGWNCLFTNEKEFRNKKSNGGTTEGCSIYIM